MHATTISKSDKSDDSEFNSISTFFDAKSIAVVGASNVKGKVGFDVIKNLKEANYKGKIFPINIKEPEIQGIKAFKSLKDVKEVILLVVVCVPTKFVSSVIDEMGALGIHHVVIITAGFKETGVEGTKLEQELAEKLKKNNIRAIGPNCLGIMDTHSRINASFASNMPLQGKLGFFSQSGALITGILDWSLNEHLGFSKFISIGNKVDIDESDLIEALGKDDRTNAILAYLESINRGNKFIEVCREVAQEKPILIFKSGTSKSGAKAASSHTGSMAGANTAYEAAFEKCGVIRTKTVEELFDYATAYASQPLPKGPRICIITNAGGPGIIATDHSENSGLTLASLSGETINYLAEHLPPAGAYNNPVDILGTASGEEYKFALETVLKDDSVDMVLIILTPQGMTEPEETARAIIESRKTYNDKPIACSFMGGPDVEPSVELLRQADIPSFPFPERAVNSLLGLYKYSQVKERIKSIKPPRKFDDVKKEVVDEIFESVINKGRVQLLGAEAINVATAYGINSPVTKTAFSVNESVRIANEIGYPVVMKITSPDITHKTDIGGVVVGVQNEDEVRNHFKEIMRLARKQFPDTKVLGIDIQEMKKTGYELIVGASADPQWGHLAIIGGGGIYTNIYQDVAFGLIPISQNEANEMIKKTKVYNILRGARGRESVNIEAIVETLERISQLITDFPEITDLDINPFFAYEGGISAVDVKITLSYEKYQTYRSEEK